MAWIYPWLSEYPATSRNYLQMPPKHMNKLNQEGTQNCRWWAVCVYPELGGTILFSDRLRLWVQSWCLYHSRLFLLWSVFSFFKGSVVEFIGSPKIYIQLDLSDQTIPLVSGFFLSLSWFTLLCMLVSISCILFMAAQANVLIAPSPAEISVPLLFVQQNPGSGLTLEHVPIADPFTEAQGNWGCYGTGLCFRPTPGARYGVGPHEPIIH